MIDPVTIPRDRAVSAFGAIWLAEPNGPVRNLGRARPPLHFGQAYATLEAAAERSGGKRSKDLPECVRLPKGTPIPGAALHLVRADDLMANGLRVEAVKVTEVEFAPPPLHMIGFVDLVASAAVVRDPRGAELRLKIRHAQDGKPSVKEVPGVEMASVHWTRAEAERTAEEVAAHLTWAANWRSR